MNVTGADASPGQPPEARAARAARQLEMLAELAEIGMALARAARRQAEREAEADTAALPPGSAGQGPDPGLVFDRLARCVRQTIALEARIDADRPAAAQASARRGERRALGGRAAEAGDGSDQERETTDLERDERFDDDDEIEAALDAGASIERIARGIGAELAEAAAGEPLSARAPGLPDPEPDPEPDPPAGAEPLAAAIAAASRDPEAVGGSPRPRPASRHDPP